MIKKGEITATIAQMFATLGTSAVDYAVKAADGKIGTVEKAIFIGTEMITQENAATYVFK
jgi:ABC-type sugar transport system substrate-binding protein